MRPGFVVVAVLAVGGIAFWAGRRTAPARTRVVKGPVEVREPAPTVAEPAGTPIAICSDALARARRAAAAPPDAGLTDTQARAMLLLLDDHDRARLEEVVRAEARGQVATHDDVVRRVGAAERAAALASAGVDAAQDAARATPILCRLRGAAAAAATQLARSELAPADWAALTLAARADAEKQLAALIGQDRLAKLRELGGLDGPPCD